MKIPVSVDFLGVVLSLCLACGGGSAPADTPPPAPEAAAMPLDGPALGLELQAGTHCATSETLLLACGPVGGALNALSFCADAQGRTLFRYGRLTDPRYVYPAPFTDRYDPGDYWDLTPGASEVGWYDTGRTYAIVEQDDALVVRVGQDEVGRCALTDVKGSLSAVLPTLQPAGAMGAPP